jgi:pyruvate formate lyase activating enzyme
MMIGGFQKFSLSDFPGRISAIVFTQGCGFRCAYCHNPELVEPSLFISSIPDERILEFLKTRRGRLQGVVVTGGEPTVHADLPRFLESIKTLGFAVKLDTNGSNSDMVGLIIARRLVDFIAMDLKAPLSSYERITRVSVKHEDIERSLELVKASGIPHELRTTYLESLLSDEEMIGVARAARGCERFALQRFHATKILDPRLQKEHPPTNARMKEVKKLLEDGGLSVVVR